MSIDFTFAKQNLAVAAHTAVDKLYRPATFASDRDRVEHLFGRYEALVNPLERLGVAKNKRVAKKLVVT